MWLLTKEAVTGIVRTFAPYLWTTLATQLPWLADLLEEVGISVEVFVLAAGTILYGLIRAGAERWPWLGSVLIVNQKPHYANEDPA